MIKYSSYDYLSNLPFYIEGIGNIKCPTLRNIREITYSLFSIFLNVIEMKLEDFLKVSGLLENYNTLNETQKDEISLYVMLMSQKPELIYELISFFICDDISYNPDTFEFEIHQINDEKKTIIGHINNENFEYFRMQVRYILGVERKSEQTPIFKNKLAKKMFERLQKHKAEKQKENDENFSLDNMILKYCTNNKVGINILNVWDMTYYQFTKLFSEYMNARQCDICDMMAANTFSYKNSSDYKPMEYMKKLNN